jgi:hypothetical protein
MKTIWCVPLTTIVFLTACVPHKQWRTEPVFSSGANPAAKVEKRFVISPDAEKNRYYSLAFVEFKDSGEAWDKRQLDEALRAIDEADKRSGHRAFVITFIHGWKNNARPDNNNVSDFRAQLNRIAADACKGDREHCGVVGVYLSWTGDVINRRWDTIRNMTYANRRDTAAHVASLPIGDALFAIMKEAKLGPDRATNHSVIVGHSFGGLILEYAITKRMREIGEELHKELGKETSSDEIRLKTLEDFADLVVLINQAAPAAEAVSLLSQFRQDLQQVNLLRPPRKSGCLATDSSQDCKALTRPLILSVSSETDLATRAILPIAETVFPPKDRPRMLSSEVHLPDGLQPKQVFTTAAAHTPQLHSHELLACDGADCSMCLEQDKFYIPVSITLPAYAPGNETKVDKPMKYCLVRDMKAWNRTPYWIFQIPPAIVPDHGTIFTDRFTDFLTSFLPPLEVFRSNENPLPKQKLYMKQSAAPAATNP